jgi:predicted CXXCH cytochrome family protein
MTTKQRLQFRILAAITLSGSVALITLNGASVVGSKHDFSSSGTSTYKTNSPQVCITCHTPHNAKADNLAPLWNHASTTTTFTLYSSTTLNATTGQPAGTTKACLSCHDGTVAVDSYGTNSGTKLATGGVKLGSDLSDDHPVSFTYDAALATADGGLKSPVSASLVVTGVNVPLFSGKLECASCHDVHDNANTSFLRMSNAGSALCLTCHVK